MNIKRMSSKAVALALSFLMLASAVVVGIESFVGLSADALTLSEIKDSIKTIKSDYLVATESYYTDKRNNSVPALKKGQWEFKALAYSDISDPMNPVVESTSYDMYRYADNVGGGGFTNQQLRAIHWGNVEARIPYYKVNVEGCRSIKFGLVDDMDTVNNKRYTYGSQLIVNFDSTTGGKAYDVQGNLRVVDNTKATGTIYYRAVLINRSTNAKKKVWPEEENWASYTVTAANYNPDFRVDPFIVEPTSDEQLAFEVYAHLDTGVSIRVDLGNVALNTIPDREFNGVEAKTTFELINYDPQLIFGRYDGAFRQNDARFIYGAYSPYETLKGYYGLMKPLNTAKTAWSIFMVEAKGHNNSTAICGVHTVANTRVETNSGAGTSYQFIVPYSGTVYMNLMAKDSKVIGNFRVFLNADQIYPTEAGKWAETSKTDKATEIAAIAKKSDVITVQYKSDAKINNLDIRGTTFTVVSNEYQNLASDSSFGAALDVPYGGKTFTGTYDVNIGKFWKFGIYNPATSETQYADYVKNTSNSKILYSTGYTSLPYEFKNNDLYVTVEPSSNSTVGGKCASVDFVIPQDGRYDVAIGGNIVSGGGKLKYRVLLDGVAVYPGNGTWASAESASDFVPVEIASVKNSKIQIQYAVTNSSSATVKLNLGTVSVYRGAKDVPAALGFYRNYPASLYEPLSITAYKKSTTNNTFTVTKQSTRFEYSSTSGLLNKYNANTRVLSTADNSVSVDFSNASLGATLSSGKVLRLTATAPIDGKNMRLTLSPNGNAQFRLVHKYTENGTAKETVVKDWTAFNNGVTFTEYIDSVAAGDKIVFEYKGNATVELGVPAMAYEGPHLDNNDPSADSFYALNSNPYFEEEYTGDYVQKEGIWNYNTIEVSKADGSVIGKPATNHYDSTTCLLKNKENGAGYILDSKIMSYQFTSDSDSYNGMSLKFIVPKDEADQEYDMAVIVPLDGYVGTVYYRIIKTVSGSSTTGIYPENNNGTGWNSQTCDGSSGAILDIPLLEFVANKGDIIEFEMYTDTDTTLILNSPCIRVTSKSTYATADVAATMYSSCDYNIFGDSVYSGSVTLPESRWNFGVFRVDYGFNGDPDVIGNIKPMNIYNSSNKKFSHSSDSSAGIIADGTKTSGLAYADSTGTNGLSCRFVSPVEGEIMLVGSPTITAVKWQYGAEIYFRIQKNNVTIWPETGDWAVGNESTGGVVGFNNIKTNVEIGDNIVYQMYIKSDEIVDRTEVFNGSLGNPAALVITKYETGKTKFNINTDFTPTYQISPYWRYLGATDSSNPNWFELGTYTESWSMFHIKNGSGCGIHQNGQREHKDIDEWNITNKHHALATELTVPAKGWMTLNKTNVSCSRTTGYVKITLTRKGVTTNLWPEEEGKYVVIEANGAVTQPDIVFEAEAGDKIRYISAVDDNADFSETQYAGGIWVTWGNTAQWTKVNPETLGDKNIYGTLDEFMLAHFKALARKMGHIQFDEDYEAHKYLSENPPVDEEPDDITPDDDNNGDVDYNPEEPTDEPEPDDEDNSDTNTNTNKNKSKKKVIKYIITSGFPIWAIVLICVGGAILLAGIIILIIVLVKRKKKNLESLAEGAAETETDSVDSSGDDEIIE